MKEMKEKLKSYVFEIIVIFLGITISFLFDGWRKEKDDNLIVRKQLMLLKNDLNRTSSWINQIDSQHIEQISNISRFKSGSEMNEDVLAHMFWALDFDPINFPVRELSPYLNKISELSGTNKISNSEEIISLSTYIITLSRVDYEENQMITNYVSDKIWSKLDTNNFLDKVLACEKEWTDSAIIWSPKKYTIDMFPKLESDLTYIELRLRRILNVHSALKNNIDDLAKELGKI